MGKINDFFAFLSNGEAGNRNICLALGDSLQHLFETVLLNTVIKAQLKAGIKVNADTVYFVNGAKTEPRVKLKDGDAVFCMKPLAGG